MNSESTVCILGGSGFVGTQLCLRLLKTGAKIKLLTRNPTHCRHLSALPSVSVSAVTNYSQATLTQELRECDVLINLIGILNERGNDGSEFHAVHVGITRDALKACEEAGVKRLLQMSALNADADGPSHYLQSKGKAENYLFSYAPDDIAVTIFQPSVIFGTEDSFLNRFAQLLKFIPLVFPLACASAKFAPVYVGDVVDCMLASLDDPASYGQKYPLCGPKVYTLKELVEYTSQISGHYCKVIALPPLLSKLQAHIFEHIPGKPLSVDNYNSLKIDSICTHASHCKTTLEEIAPSYLAKK